MGTEFCGTVFWAKDREIGFGMYVPGRPDTMAKLRTGDYAEKEIYLYGQQDMKRRRIIVKWKTQVNYKAF